MEFIPVSLIKTMDMCLEFRRDAHHISHGSDDNFNIEEIKEWFSKIEKEQNAGFYHVIHKERVIGQIEFKAGLVDESGVFYGYINLFYLIPEFRNQGQGKALQDFILEQFAAKGCKYALLRYWPSNLQGKAFYRKNGWIDQGEIGPRGQLARKALCPS